MSSTLQIYRRQVIEVHEPTFPGSKVSRTSVGDVSGHNMITIDADTGYHTLRGLVRGRDLQLGDRMLARGGFIGEPTDVAVLRGAIHDWARDRGYDVPPGA